MRYNALDEYAEKMNARKQQRLAAEKTAFANCNEDMSDVNFQVQGSADSTKAVFPIIGAIALFAAFFVIRIAHGDSKEIKSGLIFVFGVIAVLLVICGVYMFVTSKHPVVSVRGKTVTCNGKSWTNTDFSHIECTAMGKVKVHSKGKVVLSFQWENEGAELFIAWARKLGIVLLDKRMK